MDDARWLILGRWELLGTARVSPTDAPRLLLVVSLRCADGDPPPASNLLRINVSKEITNYSMRFGGDGHDASASGRRLPLGSTLGRFGANATPYAPLLPNGTAPRIHQAHGIDTWTSRARNRQDLGRLSFLISSHSSASPRYTEHGTQKNTIPAR